MLAIALSISAFSASAQASDTEIAKAILGKSHLEVKEILDKMGVWSYLHSGDLKPKVYSIENDKKRTKTWLIRYNNEKLVDQIIINCRHDDRGQVEDTIAIQDKADAVHVGQHSTDLTFKLKKR